MKETRNKHGAVMAIMMQLDRVPVTGGGGGEGSEGGGDIINVGSLALMSAVFTIASVLTVTSASNISSNIFLSASLGMIGKCSFLL